ncbi:TauD/TfdA dioxygenase family protein [Novosphingobium beihaiensis]|uniref:Uncharacterized protein n=1 Tax=Novosphingobium beihaiensis TaxID=2930389 RepID=A0ABT0BQM5_9SPHN|nr:hypothetical protein [Novosphingobium beihaiensis]MCJ2187347.1 hypothetical protein [Novosphingobium beihaiensis]
MTLPFRRIEPFGVELDFDLSQPLAPSLAYHFGELLREHGVVVAVGHRISDEALEKLCALRPGTRVQTAPDDGGVVRFTRENGDVLERPCSTGDVIFWDEGWIWG